MRAPSLVLLALLAGLAAASHSPNHMRLVRRSRSSSVSSPTGSVSEHRSSHHATSTSKASESRATAGSSRQTSSSESSTTTVLECENVSAQKASKRWSDYNTATMHKCLEAAKSSSADSTLCHSTGYTDSNRKTYGGAVHVVSKASKSPASYSVRLSASNRTLDSQPFTVARAGSDELTIASLHYNSFFESEADLAPGAVLVAEGSTSTNGSADLVQLGSTNLATASWGMFDELPRAQSIERRSSSASECAASASSSATSSESVSASKAKSEGEKKKSSDETKKKSGSSKSISSGSKKNAKSTEKKSSSKASPSSSHASKASQVGETVIINDARCKVISVTQNLGGDDSKSKSNSGSSSSSSSVSSSSTQAVVAAGAAVLKTGSIANTATRVAATAATVATAAPETLSGLVAATATPTVEAASAAVDPSASGTVSAAADQASSSAFQLPGRQLSVLPIGLGVTGGVSVLALGIVGFVSWERRRYRKQFRSRKLEQQMSQAVTSYGTRLSTGGRV